MWKDLSMKEKAAFMKVAVKNGIYDINEILSKYNSFLDGGPIEDPGMTGMMKSKLAYASQFGNPTARRMTNYDTRSAMTPYGEGNVYVGSYGPYVIPGIQDNGTNLEYIEHNKILDPEHRRRSIELAIRFDREEDARYFAENYKKIAPMSNYYGIPINERKTGGRLNAPNVFNTSSRPAIYALGGPLFNQNNPIESFNGGKQIPIVRYFSGGLLSKL